MSLYGIDIGIAFAKIKSENTLFAIVIVVFILVAFGIYVVVEACPLVVILTCSDDAVEEVTVVRAGRVKVRRCVINARTLKQSEIDRRLRAYEGRTHRKNEKKSKSKRCKFLHKSVSF